MERKTFEQLVFTPQLESGKMVKCRVGDKTFDGKIVGIATNGLIPSYIVECLDEFLPTETYPYKFVSLPLSEILID